MTITSNLIREKTEVNSCLKSIVKKQKEIINVFANANGIELNKAEMENIKDLEHSIDLFYKKMEHTIKKYEIQ